MMRPLAGYTVRLTLLLALVFPAAGSAQSLLANRGLGLVVEPHSTRAGGLGGQSLGLLGAEISWTNPAGAVGLPAAGLVASFQYDDVTASYAGIDTDATVARFPLIQAAFPLGQRWAATLGIGGYLDQNWALQRRDSLLAGEDTFQIMDRVASEGGVGRARFGLGARVVPTLSLGIGVDLFTGGVERTTGRIFSDFEREPRCCTARWDYSGIGFVGSADWTPSQAARVAVSVAAGGTLDAEAQDSLGVDASYSIPAAVDVGASARVTPTLMVALGGDWTGWSTLNDALSASGGARDAWSVQGGIEWDAIRLGSRVIPIRLGARTGDLPFRASSGSGDLGWSKERALTGGLGMLFAAGALVDFGLERGRRSGEVAANESFWRFTASVTVMGQ